MIQLTDVVKRFDGKRQVTALDHLSVRIDKGEMVAIVGPSGSGKTTLLNLVGCLDQPTSGEIMIDGRRIADLSDRELTIVRRDKIGFVFQFFNLLATLTAAENVALPLHLRGWPRTRAVDRARDILDLVGLDQRVDHLPEELSGGERQRVAIARALANAPPILLGDEPTGNLDTRSGADILALLQDLHQRLGVTLVLVTHDPQVASSCPRAVHMRDGRAIDDIRR
jgi:putative ABC transport system ATP-binding protein